MTILSDKFFSRPVTEVAPALVGSVIVRNVAEKGVLRCRVVETEAYGPGDPACHGNKCRSRRNEAMFGVPGTAYVYLIYGMYHCLNLVTDRKDIPSAVLIRAVELPSEGPFAALEERARMRLGAGPGKLCRALDIDLMQNGIVLGKTSGLWVESACADHAVSLHQCTRIGISKAKEFPWRWYDKNSPAVSKR